MSDALFCGKVAPFNGVVPSGIAPVIMLHDLGQVFHDLAAKKTIVLIEMHAHQLARVKQPIIVVR